MNYKDELQYYITAQVIREPDADNDGIKGTGYIVSCDGSYYLLTDLHCLQKTDASGKIVIPFDLKKTRAIIKPAFGNDCNITIEGEECRNEKEDFILLNIKKPNVEYNYENKTIINTGYEDDLECMSYGYPNVTNGIVRGFEMKAVSQGGLWHVKNADDGGRDTFNTVIKGLSGGGIVTGRGGKLHLLGLVKKTLKNGALHDVEMTHINSAYEKLKSIVDNSRLTIVDNSMSNDAINEILSKITSVKNENEEKFRLLDILISDLQDKVENLHFNDALKLINTLNEGHKDLLNANTRYLAETLYYKGIIGLYTQNKEWADLLEEAYKLDVKNEKYKLGLVRSFFNKDSQLASAIMNEMNHSNPLRQAYEIAHSEDPKQSFEANEIINKGDYNIRQDILLFGSSRTNEFLFLFEDVKPFTPNTFTLSNINEWLFGLSYHTYRFRNCILFNRNLVKNIEDYKIAFEYVTQYIENCKRADFTITNNAVHLYRCYWGYIISGDDQWFSEYMKIDLSELGDNRKYFEALKFSLYVLNGDNKQALQTLKEIYSTGDKELLSIAICSCVNTGDTEILMWALHTLIDDSLEVDEATTINIIRAITPLQADRVKSVVGMLSFKYEFYRNLVEGKCNCLLELRFTVENIVSNVHKMGVTLRVQAADLINGAGKPEVALEIIEPIVDVGKVDYAQFVYMQVIGCIPDRLPELYGILETNRVSGKIHCDDHLWLEYRLAMQVADTKRAYDAISLLYEAHPDDELVLCHYLQAVSCYCPEKLPDYQNIVMAYDFSDDEHIKTVYQFYAHNNLLQIASDFLYKHVKQSETHALDCFYMTECLVGKLRGVISEDANEGNYVLYTDKSGEKYCVLATSKTITGSQLLNVKPGDTKVIDICGKPTEITIDKICNKYFALNFSLCQDAKVSGGDNSLKVLNFDDANKTNILEKLESMLNVDAESMAKAANSKQKDIEFKELRISFIENCNYDDIIGSYYKMLFTGVGTAMINPIENYKPDLDKATRNKVYLDITSAILLFEFSSKYGISYNVKFHMESALYEVIRNYALDVNTGLRYDLYEAVSKGLLVRFDALDIKVDSVKRLNAFVDWIKGNCEIKVNSQLLALNTPQNPAAQLFQYSIINCNKNDTVLITDDWSYERMLKCFLPSVTTARWIKDNCTNEVYETFMKFLDEAGIKMVKPSDVLV